MDTYEHLPSLGVINVRVVSFFFSGSILSAVLCWYTLAGCRLNPHYSRLSSVTASSANLSYSFFTLKSHHERCRCRKRWGSLQGCRGLKEAQPQRQSDPGQVHLHCHQPCVGSFIPIVFASSYGTVPVSTNVVLVIRICRARASLSLHGLPSWAAMLAAL